MYRQIFILIVCLPTEMVDKCISLNNTALFWATNSVLFLAFPRTIGLTWDWKILTIRFSRWWVCVRSIPSCCWYILKTVAKSFLSLGFSLSKYVLEVFATKSTHWCMLRPSQVKRYSLHSFTFFLGLLRNFMTFRYLECSSLICVLGFNTAAIADILPMIRSIVSIPSCIRSKSVG